MTMKSVTLTAGAVLALTLAGPAWTADVAKDLAADAVQQKATAMVKEQAADTMKGVMPSKAGSDAAAAATDAAKGADPAKAVTDADPTKAVTDATKDADPTKAVTDAASKKAGGAMSGADALKAVPGGASGDMTDMVKDKATDMVKDKAADAVKEVVK